MTDKIQTVQSDESPTVVQARRAAVKKIGRFALVSAPAVTLLLAVGSKPTSAITCSPGPCPPSSRTFKVVEGSIDANALLAVLAVLPVAVWRYNPETGLGGQPHIGPYAEAFQAAFGVGGGITINPIDTIGICLSAIQSLAQKVESLEGQLREARQSRAA